MEQDENGNGTKESEFERQKGLARGKFAGAGDLRELVQLLAQGRKEKEEAEAKLATINAWYDVLREEVIPAKMEAMQIERITYEGIGRVALTADARVSIKPGVRDKFFKWLNKHKLGSLVQPGVNPSTLKAFVKDRMRAGKDVPDEFLNVTPFTRASITKV
jgi:hypothetical protein